MNSLSWENNAQVGSISKNVLMLTDGLSCIFWFMWCFKCCPLWYLIFFQRIQTVTSQMKRAQNTEVTSRECVISNEKRYLEVWYKFTHQRVLFLHGSEKSILFFPC